MKRRLMVLGMLWLAPGVATAEPCTDKVTAAIVAYDRAQRQGAGLLINHCGRPVRLELMVMALNLDGFPVARLRTTVEAGAAPLSVIRIDLPFVQSVISLSGYTTEIAATETLEPAFGRTAALHIASTPPWL